MPAVTTAPAAAAAELAKVDARPCSGWDRLLQRFGVTRDCLPMPQQLGELAGASPARWSPSRRLVGALALGGLAVVAGLALGVFAEDDDDAEEEGP